MSQSIDIKGTFERAFVINLDKNPERLVHAKNEFAKIDHLLPPLERWKGILGDACPHPELWKAGSGAWGCYRSHITLMEHCLNGKISSYIVFEDDFHISPNFEKVITKFITNLPEDWEQIYLGGDMMHLHV
jgi:GR25 family glycosyltransferase involved in LPS biosynthesis